jgi:hypothetical protein
MSLSNLSSKLDQHAEFLQFVCDHHVEDLHVVVHACRGYCCYRHPGCLCQGLPHHAPPTHQHATQNVTAAQAHVAVAAARVQCVVAAVARGQVPAAVDRAHAEGIAAAVCTSRAGAAASTRTRTAVRTGPAHAQDSRVPLLAAPRVSSAHSPILGRSRSLSMMQPAAAPTMPPPLIRTPVP